MPRVPAESYNQMQVGVAAPLKPALMPTGPQPNALIELGGTAAAIGNDLSQRWAKEQALADDLRVEENINTLREKQLDLTLNTQSGYTSQLGKNAIQRESGKPLSEEYMGQFNTVAQDLSKGLSTDRQRQVFGQRAAILGTEFRSGLLRHEGAQLKAYSSQVDEGVAKVETENAGRNWSDPAAIETSLARIDAAVERKRQREGVAAELVTDIRRDLHSAVYKAAIEGALGSNNVAAAKAMFEANKDELNQAVKDALEKKIAVSVRDGIVVSSADSIWQRFGPKADTAPVNLDAMNAEANKMFGNEPEARKQLIAELHQRATTHNFSAKERLDVINKTILERVEAPNANLGTLRKDILQTDLPFETQKFWIDRLNERIDKIAKGEGDPFIKSNGEVLGFVMKGILEHPDSWAATDITQYIGRGLSARDAGTLSNRLAEAQKPENKAKTEVFKEAHATWDSVRRGGAFLTEDERKDSKNISNILKNDKIAQGVLDEVQRREKQGQDPRLVLQELMQPYYDLRVKGYFERGTVTGALISPFVPPFMRGAEAPTKEEEVAARQLLVRQKQELTDANIQSTVEALRKKPSEGAKTGATIGAVGPQSSAGSAPWSLAQADTLKDFFVRSFGKPLPVSAFGQSATHDAMRLDHSKALDVAVSPDSQEGKAIIAYLRDQRIPYLAFSRAVPGAATGPHIHIGAPSPGK